MADKKRTPPYPLDKILPRIRVLIVDDHIAMRTGLKFFLRAFDDLELVGEAASGEQALYLCGQLKPDVVLMDLAMPGMNGVSATQAIYRFWPQIKVIALVSFREDETIQNILREGSINYLCKSISADRLAEAIRAAHLSLPNRSILRGTERERTNAQADPYPAGNAR